MQRILLALLLSAAPLCPGCGCTNWLGYVFAPASPTRTVHPDPAIPSLKGQTLAVVIYAPPQVQMDYDTAQLELSEEISAEFGRRLDGVRLVDSRRILRFQDENLNWDATPPGRLARPLGADYVLLVNLHEFTTREPGSVHLARGRITADAALYDDEGPGCLEPLWRSGRIGVVFPEETPVGVPARSDAVVRAETERLFAVKLVRHFYEHEVPKQP
jgi:hypothetical protein